MSTSVTRSTPEDRARAGEEARLRVPLDSHAELTGGDGRDPLRVLADQAPSRLPELVPVRHARMLVSPFAFYRGGAAVMAADLAGTTVSGLNVQLCGDAHLSNFGLFASPERNLMFDINDFDETYPGPWEWDVKRLAVSLVIAGRQNGFTGKQCKKAVLSTVERYRSAMAEFAAMGNLRVWYARADVDEALRQFGGQIDPTMGKRLDRAVSKARGRDHLRSLAKLTEVVDGRRRIVADPPWVVPVADLTADIGRDEVEEGIQALVEEYSSTLPSHYRELVRSYRVVDMARKIVGVGSVGTRCWVVLMRGRDDDDPLFLQAKEAQPSVLAPHLDDAPQENEGARVVAGQRLMQASGDAFLGWERATGLDGVQRDFYFRQLQDWKGSADVDSMVPKGMRLYGELCAWTLARAHARSGDRIAIAAYLGDDDGFARAVTAFAEAYADLNERDHAAFAAAVRAGEVEAAETSRPV